MNKVIITGATGMIGVSLINQLLNNNVEKIYAVIRPNSKNVYRLPKDDRIEIVECDISEYKNLDNYIHEKCDIFYHFAWGATGMYRNDSIRYQIQNIEFTLDALHVAKKLRCSKFIGAGSQAEYGPLNKTLSPDTQVNPIQPYGISKYAAGKLCMEEAKRINIDFFWCRIFSVYGIYDKDSSMITTAIKSFNNNQKIKFSKGEQFWDYLYCSDAANALYLIGQKASGHKIYCIGSGKPLMLSEYIKIIHKTVNPTYDLKLGDIPYTNNSIMFLCADISSLKKDVGFEPKIEFKEGIKMTLNYYKEFNNESKQ